LSASGRLCWLACFFDFLRFIVGGEQFYGSEKPLSGHASRLQLVLETWRSLFSANKVK
jgi:hypothetical protein